MNANNEMTDYGKRKLNATLKVYIAKSAEKNALEKECKEMSKEIKETLGAAGLTHYESANATATVTMSYTRTLDEDKIRALLDGEIPEDCYKMRETARLNIRAA